VKRARNPGSIVPGFASLHPGYGWCPTPRVEPRPNFAHS
jgi:hypothetical protein